MASYLTGASRGIGLELTKQLLELPASQVRTVIAVTRSPDCPALKDLLDQHADRSVHIVASVNDTDSVQKAVIDVESRLGARGLDVLVNNAGMTAYAPGGTKTVPPEQLEQIFNTNVIGVHRVTSAFLPLLEAGDQKKVINMAPTQAYKISKAALHMLNAQYALDHADAGFTFLCVSPGWLKTDLGGENVDLSVDISVAELTRIVLEATPAQNGKFVNIHVPGQEDAWGHYDGAEIPW
ncbi:hypothetical protein GQ44DRAFT_638772 [Phaeosphaeriaceae sp. PMI808]|nr:hypothetical protein GQ44DRAFT_638772 [Phaeosphaeriaceae sp. PMI808]